MSKTEEKTGPDSKSILGSFMTANKKFHYNDEDPIDYKVSSGSLIFDVQLDGGFGPGLHRFVGMNEGGKTSEALEVQKNFCKMPKAKGVYIKAEGRLGKEMIERSGAKFVWKYEEWEEGTIFVLETNIYETAVELMRELVKNNPEGCIYCFVLDSVDGLISKGDLDKGFEDSNKVAGGAVIAANFMKRIAIALAKRGHMAIFTSQQRADIKIDPYTKVPVRQTTATGGNALLHFANWIIEFEPRFGGDLILKDPSNKKYDPDKNPYIGHHAKVVIKKSPNETTNNRISYPICYGRKGGKSIWFEKELTDLLWSWEFLTKRGTWISATEDFAEVMAEAGFEWPKSLQGNPAIFKYIDENPDQAQFLKNYFRAAIIGDAA
jgi:RecA/RadA recombinase